MSTAPKDRGLATAFIAFGFEVVGSNLWITGRDYVFRVSQELLDAADAYWIDALAISARRLVTAMGHLNDPVPEPGTPGGVPLDVENAGTRAASSYRGRPPSA